MCELFCADTASPRTFDQELRSFFSDSVQHPHGWGLAFRDGRGAAHLSKAPERAIDSATLSGLLHTPAESNCVFAHIRYATRGALARDNCHPFKKSDAAGTDWLFMHNGSVFHPELVERYGAQARGQSDSERVFLYLLDSLKEVPGAGSDGLDLRLSLLATALAQLSPKNKLNVVLNDGAFTYAYTNTADDTLFVSREQGSALLCSRPLENGSWQPLAKRQVHAFCNGELVATSKKMGELYRLDVEELQAFILANVA